MKAHYAGVLIGGALLAAGAVALIALEVALRGVEVEAITPEIPDPPSGADWIDCPSPSGQGRLITLVGSASRPDLALEVLDGRAHLVSETGVQLQAALELLKMRPVSLYAWSRVDQSLVVAKVGDRLAVLGPEVDELVEGVRHASR